MELLSITLPGGRQINPPAGSNIPKGGEETLITIIQALIYFLFIFAIIFAIFVIIYSGWLWMTSVGDKQKIASAKQRLTYALVGLIVVFLSLFIVNFFTRFFGFEILTSIPFP
ncbi:MAG: hypothetical protein HY344_02980 [Candidatus Levybacteria bacterium]|nr:hypothetical protein [Candidatus Levybacteria bacterium]